MNWSETIKYIDIQIRTLFIIKVKVTLLKRAPMATSKSSVLKDVVAYVDVWSSDKTANYSNPFILQLQEMGAEVSKRFNKRVTHVVFYNGHPATWRNAKKSDVKLVSVLWVNRCYNEALKVDETLFPAVNDETNPLIKYKKHRSMQPKDSPIRTPDNDKRMKKKLDKMMNDLVPPEPLFTDFSPIIIDEKNGIIYSPAFKRSDYMAQRLKDMKEQNANLSATALQMENSPPGLKPSLGNTPTVFKFPYDQSDDGSSTSVAETGCSPAEIEGRTLPDVSDHGHGCLREDKAEKLSTSPSYGESRQTSISPLKCLDFVGNEDKEVNKLKRTRRKLVKRTETNKPTHSSETPDQGTSDSKNNRKKGTTTSQITFPSAAFNDGKLSSHQSDTEEQKPEQSLAETNTPVRPENVKSSTCLSSTDTAARLSKDTTSPLIKEEHNISKQAPFFSALVQPLSLPSESHRTVSYSTDGDDDVFEDYFSSANLKRNSKKPIFSNLHAPDSQIPFVLDKVKNTNKRKLKNSESDVTQPTKMRKVEKSARLSHRPEAKDKSKKPSEIDKQLLPYLHRFGAKASLTELTKKRRQSALPFMSICATTTRLGKLSLSIEPTKSEETDTSLESHKESGASHILTSRGNEHAVATGLTEAASEDQNRHGSTSLQKIVNNKKEMRTLVMTSMPTEKQSTVVQVIKTLGGFSVVDRVCASTTHVVSGSHRRTLNILLGIARGCWILSFEWILWSLEKRKWIPEEPYELSEQFPAAQICRLQRHLSAGEHQQDLFQSQPAMFVSQHSQPPTQSLIELIQLCGGTVCKTVRQAGICIGKYNGRRPEGSRILSEQWVLDSITHLKLLAYDDYTLE